jgi:hypothetical protein
MCSSNPASEIPRECENTTKRTTKLLKAIVDKIRIPRSVVVAHPGTASLVNNLTAITAKDETIPTPKIAVKAVRARMEIRSVNGISILVPCMNKRRRFMRDWPAYRFPRGQGTGMISVPRLTSVLE